MPRADSVAGTSAKRPVRCAIYTRKSTEEGLDQEFNSLDAQREACAAYIASQRHEGWEMRPDFYDDGGWSGGNMERPGLKALLADVEAGKIDVIVVYKVDRLTRALSDFARIVDILDAHDASFVSITQAFNTTTSMGRLTLNVLLSFAQFEREVISERVRDKIAASKKKGMWMGGMIPLGYDVVEKKLIVNETEAETVRHIMRRYVQLGSVADLMTALKSEGVRTKVQHCRNGRTRGGGAFGRGALYHLLQNRIYRGEIEYRGEIYAGEHEAIVPVNLWQQVQAALAANRTARKNGTNAKEPSLLAGMIRDADGRTLRPSHATKGSVRYRYYVSVGQGKQDQTVRIPAGDIERAVIDAMVALLDDEIGLVERLAPGDAAVTQRIVEAARGQKLALREAGTSAQRKVLRTLRFEARMKSGVLGAGICPAALAQCLGSEFEPSDDVRWSLALAIAAPDTKRNQSLILPTADQAAVPDMRLITLVVKGQLARRQLFEGGAAIEFSDKHMARLARIGFLAPDIVGAILEGRQPATLTARQLLRAPEIPADWKAQREQFGFDTHGRDRF
ncbi:MAG: recombinase family protein [Parasphingopyxis sp.]|uniref:recombinase family protein n=1 Tax=Parasphingopyxis sp. TaxID=1920299 RepID=UPI0032EBF59A